ncbi:hypothetical protein LNO08_01820 [Klebsiella pneumoniae subsp. pneumoniae]|nr:hypothetical protein [Klebsiella pneumoniae subsp. pneumoniae]
MKQTHYFTVNFTGFTTAASEEQSYLRLIAGEHAFYTDKRHFKDPSLFDRLRLGQPLHIGTCRLKDGSYWIHWLSDGHILLEPSRQPLSIKKASSTCRLGLFCLLDHSRLCSMVGYFFIIMFYHNVGESLRHLLFLLLQFLTQVTCSQCENAANEARRYFILSASGNSTRYF